MLVLPSPQIIGFKMQVYFAPQSRSPNDVPRIRLIRAAENECSE